MDGSCVSGLLFFFCECVCCYYPSLLSSRVLPGEGCALSGLSGKSFLLLAGCFLPWSSSECHGGSVGRCLLTARFYEVSLFFVTAASAEIRAEEVCTTNSGSGRVGVSAHGVCPIESAPRSGQMGMNGK